MTYEYDDSVNVVFTLLRYSLHVDPFFMKFFLFVIKVTLIYYFNTIVGAY
jgi:hypothetical protein